jgi:hypothetical protein
LPPTVWRAKVQVHSISRIDIMPKPRKRLVSLQATPYYHCISRCVRRAFLCGEDAHCGHSYEHRRGWIEDRMKALAAVFAIDIFAYAVMSNHYHVALHVDRERAQDRDDREVIHLFSNDCR